MIENLRMAAAILAGRQARRDGVERALEVFPKLADRRGQSARLLSGGEQQMLSLARVFVTSPKLLIADEMSMGLAPQIIDAILDGLARAREGGVTVIMIEQYVHRALRFRRRLHRAAARKAGMDGAGRHGRRSAVAPLYGRRYAAVRGAYFLTIDSRGRSQLRRGCQPFPLFSSSTTSSKESPTPSECDSIEESPGRADHLYNAGSGVPPSGINPLDDAPAEIGSLDSEPQS